MAIVATASLVFDARLAVLLASILFLVLASSGIGLVAPVSTTLAKPLLPLAAGSPRRPSDTAASFAAVTAFPPALVAPFPGDAVIIGTGRGNRARQNAFDGKAATLNSHQPRDQCIEPIRIQADPSE